MKPKNLKKPKREINREWMLPDLLATCVKYYGDNWRSVDIGVKGMEGLVFDLPEEIVKYILDKAYSELKDDKFYKKKIDKTKKLE